jgi:hypothetical protein
MTRYGSLMGQLGTRLRLSIWTLFLGYSLDRPNGNARFMAPAKRDDAPSAKQV